MGKTTIAAIGLILTSCINDTSNNSLLSYARSNGRVSPVIKGKVDAEIINEVSGIVASRNNPGKLWVHNDSGDLNRIYLIDENGILLQTYIISNVAAHDWEDIAIGPGPVIGINYIYIGDIGDNHNQYSTKHIYRFPEPKYISKNTNPELIQKTETIKVSYPEGPKDSETLLVDPLTGDIFIITKAEWNVSVYHAPYPQVLDRAISLEKITTLPFPGAVGGDISKDGHQIIIKTYRQVYYWNRNANETIKNAFQRSPVNLPYLVERQGEAISWDLFGKGYYTLGERAGQDELYLYYYLFPGPSPKERGDAF